MAATTARVVPITVLSPTTGLPINAYGVTDGQGLGLRANGNVLYALSEGKASEISRKVATFANRFPADFVGWGHNHQMRVTIPPVVSRSAPAVALAPAPVPGFSTPVGRRATPAPVPVERPKGADRSANQCAASLRNKVQQAPKIVAGSDRTDPGAYLGALDTSVRNFSMAAAREGYEGAEELVEAAKAARFQVEKFVAALEAARKAM